MGKGPAEVYFTKIHGLGNDYLYIEDLRESIPPESLPELSQEMSDRHRGVGADGIILVLPGKTARFRMRIFNADGTEAEMCGNGVRGFAHYLGTRGLSSERLFTVETKAGPVQVEIVSQNPRESMVRADLGPPRLGREEMGLSPDAPSELLDFPVTVAGEILPASAISMGNPHLVIFVPDLARVPVAQEGPRLERHPFYPRRTNVEFVQVIGRDRIQMAVWERGSGLTQACGTGAAAACVAGVLTGRTDRRVTVGLPGGELGIEWSEAGSVFLSGPVEEVFSARYPVRRAFRG